MMGVMARERGGQVFATDERSANLSTFSVDSILFYSLKSGSVSTTGL